MKVSFVSNYMTHHQLPFCQEMYSILNEQFVFIQTEEMDNERLKMGWKNEITYPFVKLAHIIEDEVDRDILKIINESDIVIWGASKYPNKFLKNRRKNGKVTFIYSERIFKKGIFKTLFSHNACWILRDYNFLSTKRDYLLCASGYAPYDFSILKCFKKGMFKWGYFTRFQEYDISSLIAGKKNDVIEILWAGRLLDWKHPEMSIRLIKNLIDNCYNCHLTIVGSGPQEEQLSNLILSNSLSEKNISMVGSVPAEKVRKYMEKANIFIFTSDFNEGWGAVLNEAMNSGCAVVASNAIGAVPFLIQDKMSGVVFNNEDDNDLFEKVAYLINNPKVMNQMGTNAYHTIKTIWNPKIAAENFIQLSSAMIERKSRPLLYGPGSDAPVLAPKNTHLIFREGIHEQ